MEPCIENGRLVCLLNTKYGIVHLTNVTEFPVLNESDEEDLRLLSLCGKQWESDTAERIDLDPEKVGSSYQCVIDGEEVGRYCTQCLGAADLQL